MFMMERKEYEELFLLILKGRKIFLESLSQGVFLELYPTNDKQVIHIKTPYLTRVFKG